MSSGDFVDGDVEAIGNDLVRLSSVLFGAKKERISEVIVAVSAGGRAACRGDAG